MRIGYYVEGRFFNTKDAQAIAYARNCANQFGRSIKVMFYDHTGKGRVVETISKPTFLLQAA